LQPAEDALFTCGVNQEFSARGLEDEDADDDTKGREIKERRKIEVNVKREESF
jgi:hypothetical protein